MSPQGTNMRTHITYIVFTVIDSRSRLTRRTYYRSQAGRRHLWVINRAGADRILYNTNTL